jgi:Nuclease-related domain
MENGDGRPSSVIGKPVRSCVVLPDPLSSPIRAYLAQEPWAHPVRPSGFEDLAPLIRAEREFFGGRCDGKCRRRTGVGSYRLRSLRSRRKSRSRSHAPPLRHAPFRPAWVTDVDADPDPRALLEVTAIRSRFLVRLLHHVVAATQYHKAPAAVHAIDGVAVDADGVPGLVALDKRIPQSRQLEAARVFRVETAFIPFEADPAVSELRVASHGAMLAGPVRGLHSRQCLGDRELGRAWPDLAYIDSRWCGAARTGGAHCRQAGVVRAHRDPRGRFGTLTGMGEWLVKYDGTCSRCGAVLARGTRAIWDRPTRSIRCIECAVTESPPPPPASGAPLVVDMGVAGQSARAEHDRRAAKRDAKITERWGTGFAAKVVRAVTDEPQSTRAWAIGAAGEEKLAAELAMVPGLRMLHDRRVPGTRGNIDHIVIGPAGVFVVDAKNHQGRIEIRDRGGWFKTDHRLTIGGRDCSAMADGMGWQVDAVVAALRRHEIKPTPPVVPVLCFLHVEWPLIRAPGLFRGVQLEGPRSLARLITARTELSTDQADNLAVVLAIALPPK